MKQDTREAFSALGAPESGHGVVVAFVAFAGVALRVLFILATAEGIKLLLDVREAQRDLALRNGELAEAVARSASVSVRQAAAR